MTPLAPSESRFEIRVDPWLRFENRCQSVLGLCLCLRCISTAISTARSSCLHRRRRHLGRRNMRRHVRTTRRERLWIRNRSHDFSSHAARQRVKQPTQVQWACRMRPTRQRVCQLRRARLGDKLRPSRPIRGKRAAMPRRVPACMLRSPAAPPRELDPRTA